MRSSELEKHIELAREGDRKSLERVVRHVQDDVYHLSLRMLVDPDDAREAAQEILIRLVTKLSTFEGRSSFKTWTYRVAVNYLINAKKVRDKHSGLNFEAFRDDLHAGLIADPGPSPEDQVALSELRISCTMAMLLCLDVKHRMAYVIGEVLEFDQGEAVEILCISKENYRQRLARARSKVEAFTSQYCGISNAAAKCFCPRRLLSAQKSGRISRDSPNFGHLSQLGFDEFVRKARSVEVSLRTITLQRAMPEFHSPEDFGSEILSIITEKEVLEP